MLKFGNICDVDAPSGLCRVEFDDDGITSDWLPLIVKNSFNTKDFFIFDIGEHVACMMDQNAENGVIIGAIYSQDRKPDGGAQDRQRIVYKDGSTFDFDMSSGTLTIDIKGDVNLKTPGSVNIEATGSVNVKAVSTEIEAPANTIKGPLLVQGPLTATAGISASGGTGGALNITGDVQATGDVKAGAISLQGHVHAGVQSGGSTTATPQ